LGRIKTKQVKRIALDIARDDLDKFKDNFANNKSKIDEIADVPSKKLRNIITGYMTRLARKKQEI
jgi:small subunit ribosomal protein S17e